MTDEHMSETTMGGADAPSPASPACEGETPALTPLSLPTEAGTAPEEHPAPPAAAGPPSRPGLTTGMNALMLEAAVVETLRTIFDPEIPVNIYDLGLIYAVQVDPETKGVHVKMTLTSPTCPVAGTLPG
ncbi:MAG TPA: iron-sulfur cluster assembly protein, partial [bacterium]|nr:iron-sulfur cluster assembly protein [bacterium]